MYLTIAYMLVVSLLAGFLIQKIQDTKYYKKMWKAESDYADELLRISRVIIDDNKKLLKENSELIELNKNLISTIKAYESILDIFSKDEILDCLKREGLIDQDMDIKRIVIEENMKYMRKENEND